ncbi:Pex19 protein [Serendipita vermifera]|nr:Pex19 protein [Serendipita vermifera]
MPPPKKNIIEDDVDDLDDVLEQFNAPSTSTSKPAASSQPKEIPAKAEGDIDEDDFAKQFAAEMEAFMKSLTNAGGEGGDADTPIDPKAAEQAEALRQAWEKLLIDDLEGNDSESDEEMPNSKPSTTNTQEKPKPAPKTGTSKSEDDFQKAVRQAMEKLKQSDDTNKADVGDMDMAGLLSAFSDLKFDGSDEDKDVQGVLETLMGQLMSKEILYEPLKELHEKFPEYLEKNRANLPTHDQVRYDRQNQIVSEVVKVFEQPDYSDNNLGITSQIVTLMTEMQELGSPPSEIMGALPPGFELGADGLPSLDDKCIIA